MSERRLLLCVGHCRVGMKVRHVMTAGRSRCAIDGEIVAVNSFGVLVHYPSNGMTGLYDDDWFRVTGAILELAGEAIDGDWAE